jgi:hypothetical protein
VVIKDPIASFERLDTHNNNAVFSLVPEEALIPVNLMIYQNSFCALSDCTNIDNSVSAASQKIPPFARTLSFLYRPRPES